MKQHVKVLGEVIPNHNVIKYIPHITLCETTFRAYAVRTRGREFTDVAFGKIDNDIPLYKTKAYAVSWMSIKVPIICWWPGN